MSVNQVTGGASNSLGLGTISELRNAQKASVQKSISTSAASASANGVANNKSGTANQVSRAELKKSVDAINHFINGNNALNFNVDQVSGRVVVQIVDRETNKVIQQIPSEEMLEIAKDLGSKKGVLLNAQA